jgi:hypothetical protein
VNFNLATEQFVLYGVNGVNDLMTLISNYYIGKVVNSSTFLGLVSSQSTINSFILMGTGLADLVLIPVRGTRKGLPLSSLRDGVGSFAKNFTLGGVGVTRNTIDRTHDLLKLINKSVSTEGTVEVTGTNNAVTMTKKGVQVLISPLIGSTANLSKGLFTFQQWMDPKIKKDAEMMYKK